jgi:ATP-binding cassette subfamily B protein
MTIGSLVAFLTYFTLILMAVMMSMFIAIMAPRAAVCAERTVEVLDTEPSVTPPPQPVVQIAAPGSLEVRDAAFQYPGAEQPVLSGLSFRARAGQTTAVVAAPAPARPRW